MDPLSQFPWAMVTAGLLALQVVSAILAPWIAKKLAEQGLVTRRQYELDQKARLAHEHRRDERLLGEMKAHVQQRLEDLGIIP